MARPLLWLGPPAAALFGYFLVGPYFAGDSKPVKMVQEAKAAAQSRLSGEVSPSDDNTPGTKADEAPDEPPKFSAVPAPRVTVGVKPVQVDETKPRRRRHRHAADSDEAPPESKPESDRNGPDPASTP